MSRSRAYFINGGAGRVISSIPAFEKLAEVNDDFIIVCEGGSGLFRGHPQLDHRVYDHWHKGLFRDKLRDRDLISLEPYRVWEYYNQKCSLAQAFDIEINGQGVRELPPPSIHLNKVEIMQAMTMINEIKARTGFDKIVVVQPFGRSAQKRLHHHYQPFGRSAQKGGEVVADPTARSFALADVRKIIDDLKQDYGVILMTEFFVDLGETPETGVVAMPQLPDLRIWAAVLELSDHFIGCDSVGQHMAAALGKTATVVTGSTFPINVSYPNNKDFDIIDAGAGRRTYSPIRVTQEEAIDRSNDHCMDLNEQHIGDILRSARSRLGESVRANLLKPTGQAHEAAKDTATAPIMSFTQSSDTGVQDKIQDVEFKVIG